VVGRGLGETQRTRQKKHGKMKRLEIVRSTAPISAFPVKPCIMPLQNGVGLSVEDERL
jgi:hypothetical protein